jgi:proteasome beta subunit
VIDPRSPDPTDLQSARDGLRATSSFVDVLRTLSPMAAPPAGGGGALDGLDVRHGTTVLALRFARGVVMAGDRRAVEGFQIADERIEKVFPVDEYATVAIAGAAGQATELVRLFQTEVEHYEKVEGYHLSLEGKANRLAQMIRANLPAAMQGLVVVPLFGGYDAQHDEGRIFRYDVTGGRWEEADYHATGSGGVFARGTLKKRWAPDMDRDAAVRVAVEALYDASQEDVATGGPDLRKGVFPSVKVTTDAGIDVVADDEIRTVFEAILLDTAQGSGWVATSPAREQHDVPGASDARPAPSEGEEPA